MTRCGFVILLLGVSGAYPRETHYPDTTTQVPIGTPDRIGPLAPLGVRGIPVGIANVSEGPGPDLFKVLRSQIHRLPLSLHSQQSSLGSDCL